ncbi:MAG: hypothetical protein ACOCYO_09900, partial [Bacteroidota bacterium]
MKDHDIIEWFNTLPRSKREEIIGQEEYSRLISKIRAALRSERNRYREELSKAKQAEAQHRRSKKRRLVQFKSHIIKQLRAEGYSWRKIEQFFRKEFRIKISAVYLRKIYE